MRSAHHCRLWPCLHACLSSLLGTSAVGLAASCSAQPLSHTPSQAGGQPASPRAPAPAHAGARGHGRRRWCTSWTRGASPSRPTSRASWPSCATRSAARCWTAWRPACRSWPRCCRRRRCRRAWRRARARAARCAALWAMPRSRAARGAPAVTRPPVPASLAGCMTPGAGAGWGRPWVLSRARRTCSPPRRRTSWRPRSTTWCTSSRPWPSCGRAGCPGRCSSCCTSAGCRRSAARGARGPPPAPGRCLRLGAAAPTGLHHAEECLSAPGRAQGGQRGGAAAAGAPGDQAPGQGAGELHRGAPRRAARAVRPAAGLHAAHRGRPLLPARVPPRHRRRHLLAGREAGGARRRRPAAQRGAAPGVPPRPALCADASARPAALAARSAGEGRRRARPHSGHLARPLDRRCRGLAWRGRGRRRRPRRAAGARRWCAACWTRSARPAGRRRSWCRRCGCWCCPCWRPAMRPGRPWWTRPCCRPWSPTCSTRPTSWPARARPAAEAN